MTQPSTPSSITYRFSDFGPQLTWRIIYSYLLLLVMALLASLVIHDPHMTSRLALTLLLYSAGFGLTVWYMHRRNYRFANQILIGIIWSATLVQPIVTGTLRQGQGAFFIVSLILATILLGQKATIVVGLLSGAALIFGYWWELGGYVTQNITPISLTIDYSSMAVLLGLTTYIVQYLVQIMQLAFQSAQANQALALEEQERLQAKISMRRQTEQSLHQANKELKASQMVLEKRVQQRTEELALANQDLETLLYVTSHDLREPLRAIQNFSQLVLRRYEAELGQAGEDSLGQVIASANQLESVIEEILMLSRAQRLVAPSEWVDGDRLVQEAIARLWAKVDLATVTIDVKPSLPLFFVDAQWLVEGLFQLLRTVIQLREPAGLTHISIGGGEGPAGPHLCITVNHDQYSRSQPQSQPRHQNANAGMYALTEQIMQKHGGTLTCNVNQHNHLTFQLMFAATHPTAKPSAAS